MKTLETKMSTKINYSVEIKKSILFSNNWNELRKSSSKKITELKKEINLLENILKIVILI